MGTPAPITDLGPTVRDLIARSGRKQVEIAARAGIDQTKLSALVNNRLRSQPDPVLVALAAALGVDAEVLRAADRRPRRTEDDLGLPEVVRHAFHDAQRRVTDEERDAYYREVAEEVRRTARQYEERRRGPSRYPRR